MAVKKLDQRPALDEETPTGARRLDSRPELDSAQETRFPVTGVAGRVATEIVGGLTDMIPGLSFFAEKVGLGVPLEGEDRLPPAVAGASRAVGQAATLGAGALAAPLRAAAGGLETAIQSTNVARQGAQAGIRATGTRFLDDTVTFAQTRPGAFFSIETGAAAAGGAAGRTVEDQGGSPTQAMLAELAAGLGTGAAIPAAQAITRVTPTVQFLKGIAGIGPSAAQRRAAGRVQRGASDAESVRVRAEQGREEVIPEAPLKLGELANDEGLLQLQRSVADATAELTAAEQARFAAVNRIARETLLDVPRGSQGPAPTAEEARLYLDSLVQERIRIARTKVDESLEKLGPRVTREDANALARVELDRAFSAAKDQERALYAQVPVTDAPLDNTLTAYRGLLNEISGDRVATRSAARDIPAALRGLLGTTDPKTGKFKPGSLAREGGVTTKELTTLRSSMQQIAAAERAKDAPNRRLIRSAETVADGILQDLDATPASEALDVARGFSRDLNQRFRQGEVGRLLGFEATGELAVPPGLTLEATLGAAGLRGANASDELMRSVERSGDPEAMASHVENFLRDEFLRAAKDGGAINPKKAETYIKRRQDLLGRFPELRRQMQQAAQAGEEVAVAQGMTDPAQSAAAVILKAPPGAEVARIATLPNARARAVEMRQLLEQDPTGRALEGVQHAIAEEIFRRSRTPSADVADEPFISPRRLGELLKQPGTRDVIDVLGDSGLLNRLRRVQGTVSRLDRSRKTPEAAEGIIGDGEALLIGLVRRFGAAAIGRQTQASLGLRGTIQGVSAFTRAADALAARGVDPAEIILIDAVTAPDDRLLSTLLSEKNPLSRPVARKRLNAWAHATAAEYGLDVGPTGEEDE